MSLGVSGYAFACAPLVMPGLVPGIHVLLPARPRKTWMAGTSPAMTVKGRELLVSHECSEADNQQ
jgi:hypothetical protein